MTGLSILTLTLLVACMGNSDNAKLPPPPDVVEAPPSTAPPQPACDRMRLALEKEVSSSYVAKNRYRNYQTAREMVAGTPSACRAGWWHLAIARLLDLGFEAQGGIAGFATPETALARALDQPDDVEVLARVAQVAALGRGLELPGDACRSARAVAGVRDRGQDRARYVCARAEIRDGNGAAARHSLDEITDPDSFADLELARAQAAKLTNDRAATIHHATAALARTKRFGHYTSVTETDRDAIIRLATPLSR